MQRTHRPTRTSKRHASIEPLEARRLLTAVYAVTITNQLLSFDSASPASISTPIAVTGLQVSETLVGIDFRPANGLLYGVGSTSRLYTINTTTGVATQVGTGTFTPALSGTAFGIDFNPVTDRLRVVSDADQNLRLNPNDGTVAGTDTSLAYAIGDANFAANPNVVALAYSNNAAGAVSTTAYDIDSALDILTTQNPPNNGTLNTVGALGVDTNDVAGLDIDTAGTAFASLTAPAATTSSLYTINLATGAATLVGGIGGTVTIRDIAVSLSGVFAFSAATYTVSETGPSATITVNRTGGTAGAASVTLSTSNGTAIAGSDYTAVNTVVNFTAGDSSETVVILITDDTAVESDETVNLTLTAPTATAILGAQNTAVLTITNNDPARLSSVWALTTAGNLVNFDSATPASISTPIAVTGLQVSETLVGIDFRPANGLLYGVGSTSRLYTINTTTGVATQVGTGTFTPALSGTAFGIDFNPVTDRLRVVSDADQNLRLNPNDGTVAGTDTSLAYAIGDANFAANPNVVALAYSNNAAGAVSTTAYDIDSALDILTTQNPPNNGTLNTVGALGVDTNDVAGLDIDTAGTAFASLTAPAATTSSLYTINLATGAATLVGGIGGTVTIRDIAVSLSGVFAFSAATYTVSETGPSATITVNRTGGTAGAASVTLSTSNGTAIAGSDYTAVNTVVNFTAGDSSETVVILITDDTAVESDETVNLTLTAPTATAILGAQNTAVLTITNNDPARLSSVWALTTAGNLVNFDSATPASISTPIAVTGLQVSETLVGIDFRPANGLLYGVGSTSRLYTINTTTGVATQVGTGTFTPALSGTAFGIDFNPVTDRLRVVSDADQNLRLNPNDGTVAGTDTSLAYAIGDANFAANPNVVALAYSNNAAGAVSTTAYDIDSALDILTTQNPPNNGTLNTVGALGVDTNDVAGLDIDTAGTAFASLTAPAATTSSLYTINLATGAATLVGGIGGTVTIRDIAVSLSGVFAFSAATYTVSETGPSATITVNRTGGTAGAASVTLSTSNGTAIAGSDYTAVNTVVNFTAGDSSETVVILITDDTAVESDETVNLTLTAPTATAILGAQNTAVLTITNNDPARLSSVWALTTAGNLVNFDSATPASISTPIAVTGLQVSETLVGIDFRPANGLLYGVGSTSRLYTINTTTGVATQVGTGTFTPALSGTAFGIDFNPVTDRLRVVSDADQNLRLNPNDGTVAGTDTSLAYAIGDANFAANPNVVALAYSNNAAGAVSTTAYDIDSALDILTTQNPPNNGTLNTVGALGVDTNDVAGLDIDTAGTAFASLTAPAATTSSLYTINLATGAATLVGGIGGTVTIRDIAVSLSGVFAFSAATYTVSETGPSATITVNRTGGTAGAASVTLSTSNGTAIAGSDYTAVNTVVNFTAGDSSETVVILITDDTAVESDETVNLTLTAPTATAILGAQNTAVLTITENDTGAANSLQFSAATYSVSESGTNATITITRSGSTAGTATVAFATSNGTATSGTDYTTVSSTVTFGVGDTSKTVNVPITNDSTGELAETVNLILSNASGATLGAQTTATLTIIDDDPGAITAVDVLNTRRNALFVTGTNGDDSIRILRRGGINLEVFINDVSQGVFNRPSRIIVRALDGNDVVRVQVGTPQSAELHGGNGNDVLIGSLGRDLLIGGAGIDVLLGRGNDDILIGGTTTLDNDTTSLNNIMAVWLRRGNSGRRAAAIRTGDGVTGNSAFNNTTIADDTSLDVLDGSVGSDLLYNSTLDVITDDDARDIPVAI